MKYKVGDRVRIKNLDWYNRHTNGTEIDYGGVPFTSGMKWFCSCVMTIRFVHADCYDMVEDSENYYTDEMIEGLVEEETYDFLKTDVPNKPSINDFMDMLDNEIKLPEGYIFKDENGNVINATKIILEKKKKEYPKTYEECVHVLEGENRMSLEQMNTFRKLIDARNAYWKIAGDEMGLGKPWEPTNGNGEKVYSIVRCCGTIKKNSICDFSNCYILEFPTAEMRDAFYENFKEEIEMCKELL